MTTITKGATVLTPTLVLGYKSERKSGNVVHPVIGTGNPDVTFGPAGLRTGTLVILCLTLADALAMEALHASSGALDLADPDLPGINMHYVPSGAIALELDKETLTRWTVQVDYQEVSA